MKNPEIKDNPDWAPLIKAVKDAVVRGDLDDVVSKYPPRLRVVAALALSLAKWHLIISGKMRGWQVKAARNCACCVCFYPCSGCPLGPGTVECLRPRAYRRIYDRILRTYTKHFNALPARDKQSIVEKPGA